MSQTTMKNIWRRAHRWLALSVGWVLLAMGFTGAFLVVAQPVDRWLHPELFVAQSHAAPGQQLAALETIRQRLLQRYGDKTGINFRLPRTPQDTLWASINGDWKGVVYFDPLTGAEQGQRGQFEGAVNTVFKLHSSLGLQDTGKALLACVALAYLLLMITGAILWWPRRWPPSWRVAWGSGKVRILFDLHRALGSALGLLIAVSVATGAYMAWRPLGDLVTRVSGAEVVKPPTLPKGPKAAGPALGVDALIAQAQAQFPQDKVSIIMLPATPKRPVRVRMLLRDDPHPNGLSSVWLHPQTGAVLAIQKWNQLDPGARAVSVVYPLHTGELGGVVLQVVIALNGLALGGLGVSGLWLWWARWARRRGSR